MQQIKWRGDAPPVDVPRLASLTRVVVAIPARDEATLIGACLQALAAQTDAPEFSAVLVLNNCRDGTAREVARVGEALPFQLHVFEVELPEVLADAAWARRLATNAAAELAGRGGIVLSTDADSRADPNWIRTMMDSFDAGADIVCGFVAPDFNDAPPMPFEALRKGALEFEYSQLTAELIALIDPDPSDPWPNHLIETGANLGIRADALASLGGVPHICPGEDAHLVAMARRRGYRIRHAFAPSVTTSSRVRGRAAGGWSEDLNARLEDQRATCHPKLEPAAITFRRAKLRARLRSAVQGGRLQEALASKHGPDNVARERILDATTFEEAWSVFEEASPALKRRPLLASRLGENLTLLRRCVARLNAGTSPLASFHAAFDMR